MVYREIPFRWSDNVPAGETVDVEIKPAINGHVKEVRHTTYLGDELTTQTKVWKREGYGRGSAVSELVRLYGKDYLDGNGEPATFRCHVPISISDVIVIRIHNTDTFSHDIMLDFVLASEDEA